MLHAVCYCAVPKWNSTELEKNEMMAYIKLQALWYTLVLAKQLGIRSMVI